MKIKPFPRISHSMRQYLESFLHEQFKAFHEGRNYERHMIIGKQMMRKETKCSPLWYVVQSLDGTYPDLADIVLWAFESEMERIDRDSGVKEK